MPAAAAAERFDNAQFVAREHGLVHQWDGGCVDGSTLCRLGILSLTPAASVHAVSCVCSYLASPNRKRQKNLAPPGRGGESCGVCKETRIKDV